MKISVFVIFNLICVVSVAAQSAMKNRAVFVLNDNEHGQWCAYNDKQLWKAEIEELQADVVGTVTLADHQITMVELTEQDETGDWIVFDHYLLDSKGEITQLKRKVNISPGDKSVYEVYRIAGGKAIKTYSVTRSLATKKIIKPQETWMPDVAVIFHAKDFPFATMIDKGSLEIQEKKVCRKTK